MRCIKSLFRLGLFLTNPLWSMHNDGHELTPSTPGQDA
jgi:hypothetical protein